LTEDSVLVAYCFLQSPQNCMDFA